MIRTRRWGVGNTDGPSEGNAKFPILASLAPAVRSQGLQPVSCYRITSFNYLPCAHSYTTFRCVVIS